MRRILLALALMAAPVLAQTESNPQEQIQKLVTLKYADPRAVRNLLTNFGVDVRMDEQMKVLALTGHRANVTTAEEAIKTLDVPGAAQKDIDLTVYFVVGSDDSNLVGSAIPPDLQSTVATLKSTFPYKTYAMLDVLSLRTRVGVPAHTSGQLSRGRLTSFSVTSVALEGDGTMVQLNNLYAGLRIPVVSVSDKLGISSKDGKATYTDTGISTEVVDVKEGQKLVVGRSSLDGPGTALVLVLIAKVAQ
jgi:hypothetical protein